MTQPPSSEPGQAGVTDAEAETWQGIYQDLYDGRQLAIQRLLVERTRYRDALGLWDDHLPGCSGSPRCECGLEEARALLGEVRDAK